MITQDSSFENMVTLFQEAGISDPKRLTKFEFEQKVDYFKEKSTRTKAGQNS